MTTEQMKKGLELLKKDMKNAKKAGNMEAYEHLKWEVEEISREIHNRWLYCID